MEFMWLEFAVEYLNLRVLRITSTAATSEANVPVPLKRSTGVVLELPCTGVAAASGAADETAAAVAAGAANATLVDGGPEKAEEPHPVKVIGVTIAKATRMMPRNALAEEKENKRTKPP
jgi:hypothetical protein